MNFQYLGMDFAHFIVFFFVYAFLGWCMECVVIRRELGRWENRGFSFMPFCVIYGFGVVVVSSVFEPVKDDYITLMIFGSAFATTLEFMTAMIMLKLFGKIWWDYSHLKFNFKGILSLESSIAWGCIAVFVVSFWNDILISLIERIPHDIAFVSSIILVVEYVIDFAVHFYKAVVTHSELFDDEIEELIDIDKELAQK